MMGIIRPIKCALHAVFSLFIFYHTSIVLVDCVVGAEFGLGGTSYTEDLTLQRLGQNHVAARFVFRSTWIPQKKHRCQEHEDWSREETIQEHTPKNISGKLCNFEAVFPRAVGVLLDRFKVHHLSLRMSKGRWDTVAWGNAPEDGGEYTSGGAEMLARLPSDGAWESWVGLRRSLSGLYCSSLNGMDDSRVHTPAVMTLPGDTAEPSNATTILRGTLPREPVCTENLIPLIKMLPCRSKTGLASLLHPTRLFQSDYYSVSVRATASFAGDADGGRITSLTLEQAVLAVFRPRPYLFPAVHGSQRGLARESSSVGGERKQGHSDGNGWSISSLLLPPKSAKDAAKPDRLALRGCPVATRSAIHVRGGVNGGRSHATCIASTPATECNALQEVLAIDDEPSDITRRLASFPSHQERLDAEDGALESLSFFLRKKLWDIDEGDGVLPARAATATANEGQGSRGEILASPAVAWLENFLAGRGGTRGVSVSHLVNAHPDEGAYTEFLQPVPYFMVPLLGSLRARVIPSSPHPQSDDAAASGADTTMSWDDIVSCQSYRGKGQEGCTSGAVSPVLSLAQNLSFTPGEGRHPAIVEARLWVPAASILVLSFDFFKRFLTVDDFPPDPSRGFDVPPPLAKFHFSHVVTASFPTHGGKEGIQGAAPASRAAEILERADQGRVVYAYGEAGLLDAPQPDFSMPFNVITFTSTVITFFLGTAINLLVRKSARGPKKKRTSSKTDEDRQRGRDWFGRARATIRKRLWPAKSAGEGGERSEAPLKG